MKKIDFFLDPNTPFKKLEELMSELLKEKFDQDLKNHYKNVLETKYQYHRNPELNSKKLSFRNSPYRKILLILGIILSLIASVTYMKFMNSNMGNQEMVQVYLDENPMFYNDTYRSNSDNLIEENRRLAFKNINAKDYSKALTNFGLLDNIKLEDDFYISYCKLSLNNYQDAYSGFKSLNGRLKITDKYYHETRFYFAVCLYVLNREDELSSLTVNWENDSWEFAEFNKFTRK